jgi:hypothetical protein
MFRPHFFAATDQYDYDLRGLRHFDRQLIDEGPDDGDWNWMDVETLSRLIEPDCVDDDLNLMFAGLQRRRILERLRLGLPVLRREGLTWKPDPVVSIFKDRDITVDNILKIADPSRMTAGPEDDDTPGFEFWAGDVFCRAAASGKANEDGVFRLVYLQDGTHALMLLIGLEEEPRSLMRKLTGGPRTEQWRMTCKGRRLTEEDGEGDEEWHEIAQPFPEEFHPLLGSGWNTLLDAVSTYDHSRTLVDPNARFGACSPCRWPSPMTFLQRPLRFPGRGTGMRLPAGGSNRGRRAGNGFAARQPRTLRT